jgi:hypothetical protein
MDEHNPFTAAVVEPVRQLDVIEVQAVHRTPPVNSAA